MVVWESTTCGSQRDIYFDVRSIDIFFFFFFPLHKPKASACDVVGFFIDSTAVAWDTTPHGSQRTFAGGSNGVYLFDSRMMCFPTWPQLAMYKIKQKSDRARCWFGRIENRYLSPKRYIATTMIHFAGARTKVNMPHLLRRSDMRPFTAFGKETTIACGLGEGGSTGSREKIEPCKPKEMSVQHSGYLFDFRMMYFPTRP
jgi:hypothetical protein